MSSIQVNKVGDSLTGAVNGKAFGIAFQQNKYDMLLELQQKADAAQKVDELTAILEQATKITAPNFQEVIDSATPFLSVNPETGAYYTRANGVVSKVPVPKSLKERIEKALAMSLNVDPILKCWNRMLRNHLITPKKAKYFAEYINATYMNPEVYNEAIANGVSSNVATERATTLQVSITMEGLICTYKVSEEITKKFVKDEAADGGVKQVDRHDYDVDEFTGLKIYKKPAHVEDLIFQPASQKTRGDEFSCQNLITKDQTWGHIIRVGCIHELKDWSKVNCDDNDSCVPGLHVGNLDYIRCYQHDGTVTHNTFVDPMDIGAFVQGKDGALRVRRYMTHSSFAGVNKNLYHSSHLSKITDAEYTAMITENVKKSQAQFEQDKAGWEALITG